MEAFLKASIYRISWYLYSCYLDVLLLILWFVDKKRQIKLTLFRHLSMIFFCRVLRCDASRSFPDPLSLDASSYAAQVQPFLGILLHASYMPRYVKKLLPASWCALSKGDIINLDIYPGYCFDDIDEVLSERTSNLNNDECIEEI